MTSFEMVRYKRTDDMEILYQILSREKSIQELWDDTAMRLAKAVLAGKYMGFNTLADEYGKKIAVSFEILFVRYHKITGEWLKVTNEQKNIVAWQWFYTYIMETALLNKQELQEAI